MADLASFIPLQFDALTDETMQARAKELYQTFSRRRSVRHFSDRVPPRSCVEYAIRCAGTAPSGAHRQPWKFVLIDDPDLKRQVRLAAEKEERESYDHRFPDEWREALAPLGTDWQKPYLEIVPYIVVVFKETSGRTANGEKVTNYYVNESVGIACGLFIAALHQMGLVTLTHTPNPMGFLSELLRRPANEKPYIMFPVGFPGEEATVPNLQRKDYDQLVQINAG